ncbi:MAG TPA: DinB family protein [Acidisarcina sp.]
MDENLRKRFDQLQVGRSGVLAEITAWTPGQLQYRPAETCWSAIEVIDHLTKVERAAVALIEESLVCPHSITFENRVKTVLVNLVMRSPLRVKVPTVVSHVLPSSELTLRDVAAEWEQVRLEMKQTLEAAPIERVGVFKHPVAGWMTLPQAMAFLHAHLIHHRYQINRLKRLNS